MTTSVEQYELQRLARRALDRWADTEAYRIKADHKILSYAVTDLEANESFFVNKVVLTVDGVDYVRYIKW